MVMYDDEEGKMIEWDDMPLALKQAINTEYEVVKNYPLMSINLALMELKEDARGLRPIEEIK